MLAGLAQRPKAAPSREYPTPAVREEQTVVVDGVREIWRLQWMSGPKPACSPSDPESDTFPCLGFAYGDAGALDLVRLRDGAEIDRLALAPLFEETPAEGAVVERWQPDLDKDFEVVATNNSVAFPQPRENLAPLVRKRPTVQVMHFGDYDHTGWKNEFYLQSGAAAGHTDGFVVGVSKRNRRLHALGTASSPRKPLYLEHREWEALRDASGPLEVVHWRCGDHGAENESTVRLGWTAGGIAGTRRVYTCPPDARKLIREDPL
jgi:hypothetical protein